MDSSALAAFAVSVVVLVLAVIGAGWLVIQLASAAGVC